MLKKRYIILALGVVSVLFGSLLVDNLILAQSGSEYDPWLDYNEDGTIDVNDLSPLGQAYGSSGDPAKNVNVTNWPEWLTLGRITVANWTTYADFKYSSLLPGEEVTLFTINGRGKLRFLSVLLIGESMDSASSRFKIFVDDQSTIEISPALAYYWPCKDPVSIPRVFLELYDSTLYDFEWGVELESYFKQSLVINFTSAERTKTSGVNAYIIYEKEN